MVPRSGEREQAVVWRCWEGGRRATGSQWTSTWWRDASELEEVGGDGSRQAAECRASDAEAETDHSYGEGAVDAEAAADSRQSRRKDPAGASALCV